MGTLKKLNFLTIFFCEVNILTPKKNATAIKFFYSLKIINIISKVVFSFPVFADRKTAFWLSFIHIKLHLSVNLSKFLCFVCNATSFNPSHRLKFHLRLFSNLNSLVTDIFPKSLLVINTWNWQVYSFLQWKNDKHLSFFSKCSGFLRKR